MKTDQLIRALATDGRQQAVPLQTQITVGLAAGFAAAVALFIWRMGMRPDFSSAIHDPLFVLKFVITLALAFPAFGLLWRLIRPGSAPGFWIVALLAAPIVLAGGIAYEMMAFPPSTWMPRLIGHNSMFCLRMIPLLSAPVLIALLIVMRLGAAMHPALAGAVAGLAAGGIAATLYASHCVDDSPLFVMAWYGISIAIVTAIGAVAGARLLRW
jgi:hypothetical protein